MEYRAVVPKKTKPSPPKDYTKKTSTSKQPSKEAKVVNTSNVFDVLVNLDEDSNVHVEYSAHIPSSGDTIDSFGSPSTTSLIDKSNNLESQLGTLCF